MKPALRARAIASRIGQSLLVLFGVSILIFSIARVIPGDPARIALGPNASADMVAQLSRNLHLNEPLPVQYWWFLKGLSEGDLGVSLYTNRPVMQDIAEFLPATLELVILAGAITVVVGIGLGVVAGRARDGWSDNLVRLVSLLGVVTPTFVWAVALMLAFAYFLDLLPVAGRLSETVAAPPRVIGMTSIDALIAGQWATFRDALAHMILPAAALAMTGVGQTARLVRANVAESYDRPYVEMARAYGYPEWRIATRYALKPAMIPALTILGLEIAAMLGNAFLVEQVFGWPGLARYGVQAILHKDLNAIVGTVLVISAFFILINIIVDVIVVWLNPRIRLERGAVG